MRVLLVGGSGQLGRSLRATAPSGYELVSPRRDELDLENDATIASQLRRLRPEVVVNAGAYTAVDQAESEPSTAFAINAEGPRRLAAGLRDIGARLIQISTDFVFDGTSAVPYLPADRPNPIGVYGASKLEGERAVLEMLPERALVVRTSWLYAAEGTNFVNTMLRLLGERQTVRVVADQEGSPTWTLPLAEAIWRWTRTPGANGIRHWADAGTTTWYGLAVAVAEEGAAMGLLDQPARVVPIPTAEYPTPARRPAMSALDSTASCSELGLEARPWTSSLHEMLGGLRQSMRVDRGA